MSWTSFVGITSTCPRSIGAASLPPNAGSRTNTPTMSSASGVSSTPPWEPDPMTGRHRQPLLPGLEQPEAPLPPGANVGALQPPVPWSPGQAPHPALPDPAREWSTNLPPAGGYAEGFDET